LSAEQRTKRPGPTRFVKEPKTWTKRPGPKDTAGPGDGGRGSTVT
jgi:hypothetical protein